MTNTQIWTTAASALDDDDTVDTNDDGNDDAGCDYYYNGDDGDDDDEDDDDHDRTMSSRTLLLKEDITVARPSCNQLPTNKEREMTVASPSVDWQSFLEDTTPTQLLQLAAAAGISTVNKRINNIRADILHAMALAGRHCRQRKSRSLQRSVLRQTAICELVEVEVKPPKTQQPTTKHLTPQNTNPSNELSHQTTQHY